MENKTTLNPEAPVFLPSQRPPECNMTQIVQGTSVNDNQAYYWNPHENLFARDRGVRLRAEAPAFIPLQYSYKYEGVGDNDIASFAYGHHNYGSHNYGQPYQGVTNSGSGIMSTGTNYRAYEEHMSAPHPTCPTVTQGPIPHPESTAFAPIVSTTIRRQHGAPFRFNPEAREFVPGRKITESPVIVHSPMYHWHRSG